MTNLDPLLERHSPAIREVLLALADLVRSVVPDAHEQLDLPDHLLAFGFAEPGAGVRMRGLVVALIPHTGHVNVQLADGVLLDDPDRIVEGTGKRIRHVKVRSLDDVQRPALRRLIEEQATRRR